MKKKSYVYKQSRNYKMSSADIINFYKIFGMRLKTTSKIEDFYFYFYKDVISDKNFEKRKLIIERYEKRNVQFIRSDEFNWLDYYIQSFDDYKKDDHQVIKKRYIIFKFAKFMAFHNIDKRLLYDSLISMGDGIIDQEDIKKLRKSYDVVVRNLNEKRYKDSFRRNYETFESGKK